jgi:hypothetical protein
MPLTVGASRFDAKTLIQTTSAFDLLGPVDGIERRTDGHNDDTIELPRPVRVVIYQPR